MQGVLTRAAVAALALVAACGGSSSAKPKVFKVAVIPKGTSHEFWKAVEAGARKADAELADLEIVWKGPSGEGDTAQEIALVESFIADRYDGICVAPLDARALETPVRTALTNKVPVVIFDSDLARKDLPITSYVATDNHHGGELAGEELSRVIGGKGNVVLMRYQIGSESTEQREQGFLATSRSSRATSTAGRTRPRRSRWARTCSRRSAKRSTASSARTSRARRACSRRCAATRGTSRARSR